MSKIKHSIASVKNESKKAILTVFLPPEITFWSLLLFFSGPNGWIIFKLGS
jgi:hypothetical protein